MKKLLLISMVFLLGNQLSTAQSILIPGDIAFLALNADGSDDEFTIILLRDIVAGTEIKFSDQGWNDGVGFFSIAGDDGHFIWTAGANMSCGDLVTFLTNQGSGTPSATTGSTSGSSMLLGFAGDQIFAFQGTFDITANFIAGIHYNVTGGTGGANWDGSANSTTTSALPDTLTDGVNAVWVYASGPTEHDNFIYDCVVTNGDYIALGAEINDVSNWTTNATTPHTQNPFPCSFTVSSCRTLGIDEVSLFSGVSLFPNPSKGRVNIHMGSLEQVDLKVFNISGQLVFEKRNIGPSDAGFDFKAAAGLYFVELSAQGNQQQFKLIRN